MRKPTDTLAWAENIGSNIRTHRKGLGLSLEELSRLSGSSVPTLSHIERGTRDLKLSTLVSLSLALRCDLSAFIQPDTLPASTSTDTDQEGYDLEDDCKPGA